MDARNAQCKFVQLDDGTAIVVSPDGLYQPTSPVLKRLAEGRAFHVNSHNLPDHKIVDIAEVAGRVRALRAEVASQFVGRGELVNLAALALVSGDHAFTQGPPGTGKSRILRLFAEGLDAKFFAVNLAKDTTREMLFGPVSMQAIREDRWDRMWNGLATAQIALIDEVWEANSAVTTILKPILEERRIEEAGVKMPAPLLSAFGASNFVPDDRRQSADWDRWLYRLPVRYIGTSSGMRDLAFADAGSVPIDTRIYPPEILALSAYTDYASYDVPDHLVEAWVGMWIKVNSAGFVASDRRWKRLLRSAMANAILSGEEPDAKHLAIGRWILWDDPDQYKPLSDLILGLVDDDVSQVLAIEKHAEDLEAAWNALDPLDWESRSMLGVDKVQKLKRAVKRLEEDGITAYNDRIDPVRDLIDRLESEIVVRWEEGSLGQ